MDAAIEDRAVWRTTIARRARKIEPSVHGDARAHGFQTIDGRPVDARHMRQRPAQIANRCFCIYFLERGCCELIFSQRQRVLLKCPSVFGNELKRRLIIRWTAASSQTPLGRELANAGSPDHVIAEIREGIQQALLQNRNIRPRVLR